MMTTQAQIDEARLMDLVGQAVNDMGSGMLGNLIFIGDKLGLFRGLAHVAPMTPGELAAKTGTAERYVREWLNAQAAGGYVTYAGDGKYTLSPEQAEALTNEESPACVLGGFQGLMAATMVRDRLMQAFKTGEGIGWHEHDANLFEGTERFFRPGYAANLVASWLPALDGVVAKLEQGADVADVGCGHGASTIIMAKAYSKSKFTGFDYHRPSIDAAKDAARKAGVSNADFQTASAKDYPGKYDLVAHFDCLHDMGDPVGAAEYTLKTLKPHGTWMIVEPFANDDVAQNLNPVGKVYYAASTFICTPASLSQEVGLALGAQAGESRMREVVT